MEGYDVERVSHFCMEYSEEIKDARAAYVGLVFRYSERRQTVVFEVIKKVN